VISRSAVPIRTEVKLEVKEEASDKAFSMEERIDVKDFHKISNSKLASRVETLDCYDNLALHGAMYGIFVPPSESIAPHNIMRTILTKKLMGVSIYGRRSSMESHIYNLLLSDGICASDCREEYLDAVKVARGDGYAALHNILCLHHPCLRELIVEVNYPSQTVTIRFV
jgi:hypothetical protein